MRIARFSFLLLHSVRPKIYYIATTKINQLEIDANEDIFFFYIIGKEFLVYCCCLIHHQYPLEQKHHNNNNNKNRSKVKH